MQLIVFVVVGLGLISLCLVVPFPEIKAMVGWSYKKGF